MARALGKPQIFFKVFQVVAFILTWTWRRGRVSQVNNGQEVVTHLSKKNNIHATYIYGVSNTWSSKHLAPRHGGLQPVLNSVWNVCQTWSYKLRTSPQNPNMSGCESIWLVNVIFLFSQFMETKNVDKIEKKKNSLDLSAPYYLQWSWLGAIGAQREMATPLSCLWLWHHNTQSSYVWESSLNSISIILRLENKSKFLIKKKIRP